MLIEIRGVGFENKGAELMLHAILQRASKEWPNVEFAMAPVGGTMPYSERAKLGLYQKLLPSEKKAEFLELKENISIELREKYGLVLNSEIDVVLDASGFAYGDQMGEVKSIHLAQSIKRWSSQGTKVVLLPQAFGPFSSPGIKDAVKVIADYASLIFARDKISYDYLTGVVGERKKIRIAPDFTNLIEGIVPDDFDQDKNRFCIVPNYKMIEVASPEKSAVYIPFLITCARYLQSKGTTPFIMVHSGINDFRLAELVANGLNEKIEIIRESNPLKIKGILGKCEGVISSRFHGLVSALSQGVPSLATGWSHKYRALFQDYDFQEGLIDLNMSEAEIRTKIDTITDVNSNHSIRDKIKAQSKYQKKNSESMWREVITLIGS